MNWRVKLLCTLIVLAFISLGFLYVRVYVAPKAHGVILFIAPGLELSTIQRASQHLGTHTSTLPHIAKDTTLVHTCALTPHLPEDDASLYSLLSTGLPGLPQQLGLSLEGHPSDNLFYQAQRSARLIGIISSNNLLHPVNAAFFAHTTDIHNKTQVSRQLFDSTDINMILGGADPAFFQAEERNLIEEAKLNGYQIALTADDLERLPKWRTRKVLGVYDTPLAKDLSLSHLVKHAIECLQFHLTGYFLVITHTDAPDPQSNEGELLDHFQQLEAALLIAKSYAGENTWVLLYCPQTPVTHGTGWAALIQGSSSLPAFSTPASLHKEIQTQF